MKWEHGLHRYFYLLFSLCETSLIGAPCSPLSARLETASWNAYDKLPCMYGMAVMGRIVYQSKRAVGKSGERE